MHALFIRSRFFLDLTTRTILYIILYNRREKEKNIHFKIENSIQLKDRRNDQTKFSNFIVIDSKRVSFFYSSYTT